MKRNMEMNAIRGRAIAGKADMTSSELNVLFDMLKNDEVFEAISTAFGMGVYVGFKKGRKNGHRKTA